MERRAMTTRIPQYPADDLFVNRWSPRAFTGESIPDLTLRTLFEAVRWAPSSNNSQPWRLLFAKRGSPDFDKFLALLGARNQTWANRASVLIVIVSKSTHTAPGQQAVTDAPNHSFDAGAAWAHLALQASLLGWSAHAMGGFDRAKARDVLNVPRDYHVDIAIAVGKRGDKSILPEEFHSREAPSGRLPISEITIEGGFPESR
jgi:nitroreductase